MACFGSRRSGGLETDGETGAETPASWVMRTEGTHMGTVALREGVDWSAKCGLFASRKVRRVVPCPQRDMRQEQDPGTVDYD